MTTISTGPSDSSAPVRYRNPLVKENSQELTILQAKNISALTTQDGKGLLKVGNNAYKLKFLIKNNETQFDLNKDEWKQVVLKVGLIIAKQIDELSDVNSIRINKKRLKLDQGSIPHKREQKDTESDFQELENYLKASRPPEATQSRSPSPTKSTEDHTSSSHTQALVPINLNRSQTNRRSLRDERYANGQLIPYTPPYHSPLPRSVSLPSFFNLRYLPDYQFHSQFNTRWDNFNLNEPNQNDQTHTPNEWLALTDETTPAARTRSDSVSSDDSAQSLPSDDSPEITLDRDDSAASSDHSSDNDSNLGSPIQTGKSSSFVIQDELDPFKRNSRTIELLDDHLNIGNSDSYSISYPPTNPVDKLPFLSILDNLSNLNALICKDDLNRFHTKLPDPLSLVSQTRYPVSEVYNDNMSLASYQPTSIVKPSGKSNSMKIKEAFLSYLSPNYSSYILANRLNTFNPPYLPTLKQVSKVQLNSFPISGLGEFKPLTARQNSAQLLLKYLQSLMNSYENRALSGYVSHKAPTYTNTITSPAKTKNWAVSSIATQTGHVTALKLEDSSKNETFSILRFDPATASTFTRNFNKMLLSLSDSPHTLAASTRGYQPVAMMQSSNMKTTLIAFSSLTGGLAMLQLDTTALTKLRKAFVKQSANSSSTDVYPTMPRKYSAVSRLMDVTSGQNNAALLNRKNIAVTRSFQAQPTKSLSFEFIPPREAIPSRMSAFSSRITTYFDHENRYRYRIIEEKNGFIDWNDIPDGRYLIRLKDGTVIKGEFKDSKLQDQGSVYNSNGFKIVGEFKNNQLIKGTVTFTLEDGSSILMKGSFKNDRLHGNGIIYHYQSSHTHPISALEGLFRDGQLYKGQHRAFYLGAGEERSTGFTSDLIYEGQFNNKTELTGKGSITFGDVIYEGNFKENLLEGLGTIIIRNTNIQIKGNFSYGKLKGPITIIDNDQPSFDSTFKGKIENGEFSWNTKTPKPKTLLAQIKHITTLAEQPVIGSINSYVGNFDYRYTPRLAFYQVIHVDDDFSLEKEPIDGNYCITFKEGTKLQGSFKNSNLIGKGFIRTANGCQLSGKFENNQSFEGEMIFVRDDASTMLIQGAWQDDLLQGRVMIHHTKASNSLCKLNGDFINGKLVEGRYQTKLEAQSDSPLDLVYEGHFNDRTQMHGDGSLTLGNITYKGNFRDGLLEGLGIIIFNDTTEIYGHFSLGKLEGLITITSSKLRKSFRGTINKENVVLSETISLTLPSEIEQCIARIPSLRQQRLITHQIDFLNNLLSTEVIDDGLDENAILNLMKRMKNLGRLTSVYEDDNINIIVAPTQIKRASSAPRRHSQTLSSSPSLRSIASSSGLSTGLGRVRGKSSSLGTLPSIDDLSSSISQISRSSSPLMSEDEFNQMAAEISTPRNKEPLSTHIENDDELLNTQSRNLNEEFNEELNFNEEPNNNVTLEELLNAPSIASLPIQKEVESASTSSKDNTPQARVLGRVAIFEKIAATSAAANPIFTSPKERPIIKTADSILARMSTFNQVSSPSILPAKKTAKVEERKVATHNETGVSETE